MPFWCLQAIAHGGGSVGLIFTDNAKEIERFKAEHDQPDRGVYRSVNPLLDGASRRARETVAEIQRFVFDFDFKSITESPEKIRDKLVQLPVEPTKAVMSGGGWHIKWELREPLDGNDAESMARAARLSEKLAYLLGADPMPTKPHSLLREEGSTNYKYGEPVVVKAEWGSSQPVDLTELEELAELLEGKPYLTYVPKAGLGANGSSSPSEKFKDEDLDAMTYGVDMHVTQCRAMASKIARGISVEESADEIVESTYLAAVRADKANEWDWTKEVNDVMRSGFDFINKHPEYRDRLPPDLEVTFSDKLFAGHEPKIVYSKYHGGWHVRGKWGSAASITPGNGASEAHTTSVGKPAAISSGFVLNTWSIIDPTKFPRRQWLYGRHYLRRTTCLTSAPGGMGKSSLLLVEGLAMATGRNLLGEQPTERLKVWYHNAEEPKEEIERRVLAICQHFNIPQEELVGWFFPTSGTEVPLKVAHGYSELKVDGPLIEQINSKIIEHEIDVMIVDPLIRMHGVPEGDNGKMDAVMQIFTRIADVHHCCVAVSHHTRKLASGTSEYGIDDSRGATAIGDAVRSARVLNQMSKEEAEKFAIDEEERLDYFKVAFGKVNNARKGKEIWRRFVSVTLPDDADGLDDGDEVGVLVEWVQPGHGQMTPAREEILRKADHVYLTLIDRFNAEGRCVNPTAGPSYAPARFAKEPEAKLAKVSKEMLAEAQRRLFADKKIKLDTIGSGARERRTIVRT
jgi:RecA-family ATPase